MMDANVVARERSRERERKILCYGRMQKILIFFQDNIVLHKGVRV